MIEAIQFSGSYSFYWKPFFLSEVVPFNGGRSFQWKAFILGETVPSNENYSSWLKALLIMEAVPFKNSLHCDGNHSFIHSFLLKLFHLVEVINFNRIHSFSRMSFSLVKVTLFNGRILNLVRQKNVFVNDFNLMNLILLEEVCKISSSYSKCVLEEVCKI